MALNKHNETRKVVAPVFGDSLTQQQFQKETDINQIMDRYARVGNQPKSRAEAIFGDFTSIDFLDAQNKIISARAAFMALPSKVRRRFNNEPATMLRFLEDPENRDEAVKLGLLNKPEEKAPEAAKPPVASPEVVKADPEAQPNHGKPGVPAK